MTVEQERQIIIVNWYTKLAYAEIMAQFEEHGDPDDMEARLEGLFLARDKVIARLLGLNIGAGNDTITSNGDNAVLDGGNGDDQFVSNGDNAFNVGGLGNDSVTLSSDAKNNITVSVSGDGHDTVWGFTPEDSLVAYGYDLSTTRSGDNGQDILLTTESGSVLLKDVGNLPKVNIAGAEPEQTPSILPDTTPAVSQENDKDDAQVELKDNDSVKNTGNRVTITGSDGNNVIDNTGDNVSIDAGDGTDTVNTTGDSVNADNGKEVTT